MSALPSFLVDIARIPAVAVGLPIAIGGLVGYNVNTKNAWYASLKQPPANPPDWAFGPVWTILYGMMGYASHLVAEVAVKNIDPATRDTALGALGLYYAQLALNFAWMPLFFSAKRPIVALADIGVLTATVFAMTDIMNVLPTRVPTFYLLAPYCGWLCYATYLNGGIAYLNWNAKGERKL
ncbi:TspO/MBR-related protein [Cutaneotrichosporon oleaginosum]|uniref:TspO/MBR-related protein n=1 Tax=Cutaneotrichosporon oleaginosum TaxID=879819 RepID=A0A0J1BCG5_9TREE|nr:TspO/MBR-related protein [Cutaneotrichosporon oleaginosum]KLT45714.1 TspO/MBR-related protein [Cutaneotrichosporon oleaginosum]